MAVSAYSRPGHQQLLLYQAVACPCWSPLGHAAAAAAAGAAMSLQMLFAACRRSSCCCCRSLSYQVLLIACCFCGGSSPLDAAHACLVCCVAVQQQRRVAACRPPLLLRCCSLPACLIHCRHSSNTQQRRSKAGQGRCRALMLGTGTQPPVRAVPTAACPPSLSLLSTTATAPSRNPDNHPVTALTCMCYLLVELACGSRQSFPIWQLTVVCEQLWPLTATKQPGQEQRQTTGTSHACSCLT